MVLHEPPAVFLVYQPRKMKAARVLADRLHACPNAVRNVFQGHGIAIRDEKQNLDAVVIRHPLKVPLHLLCGL